MGSLFDEMLKTYINKKVEEEVAEIVKSIVEEWEFLLNKAKGNIGQYDYERHQRGIKLLKEKWNVGTE